MSIIQGTAKSGTTAGGVYNYPIEQSLRFNKDDSAGLSRTNVTSTNSKIWTFSTWVKRVNLETGYLLSYYKDGNYNEYVYFAGDALSIKFDINNSADLISSAAVFRDPSAWYHVVGVLDTTDSDANERIRLYVNGERITDFASANNIAQNANSRLNTGGYSQFLGKRSDDSNPYGGYLANIQFIDGQALDASSFGELKSGVWVPKAYTGTYGTNGFHLDFADPNNIGNDVSGNNNHWTVN